MTLNSLVGSCKCHPVDPSAYLKDMLERLPAYPADRLANCCPTPCWRRVPGRNAGPIRKT